MAVTQVNANAIWQGYAPGTVLSYLGPFVDGNNNLYVFSTDGTAHKELAVWKSTDGGSNWTQQDTANQPAVGASANDVIAIASRQVGTILHVSFVSDNYSTGMANEQEVRYATFHTSDAGGTADSWQIDEQVVLVTDGGSGVETDIEVRSDGDVIVSHYGDGATVMGSGPFPRSAYSRREGGTWTTGILAHPDQSGEGNTKHPAGLVKGTNDAIHFIYQDGTTEGDHDGNDVTAVTLHSDNSQSTTRLRVIAQNAFYRVVRPISWDNGGTQQVQIANNDGITRRLQENSSTQDIELETGQAQTNVGASPFFHGYGSALVRESGGEVYFFYDDASTSDLISNQSTEGDDADWGTPTEEEDAVTVRQVWTNFYNRGGTNYIGIIYAESDTTLYFKEISIVPPSQIVNVGLVTETETVLAVNKIPLQVGLVTENESVQSVKIKEKYQYLRPIADLATGSWTATPLWSKVDEESPDTADSISSESVSNGNTSSTAVFEMTNTGITDPGPGATAILRATIKYTGDEDHTIGVYVKNISDDSTVFGFLDFGAPGYIYPNGAGIWYTQEVRWAPEAIDAVIDWNDLKVEWEHTAIIGAGSTSLQVAWFEIEIIDPGFDAPMAGSVSIPYSFAGPVTVGADTYVLAKTVDSTGEQLWLFKATNPSDGFNPSEWSNLGIVDRSAKGFIHSAAMQVDAGGDINIVSQTINRNGASIFNFQTVDYSLQRYLTVARFDVGLQQLDIKGGRDSGALNRITGYHWEGQDTALERSVTKAVFIGRQAAGDYHILYTIDNNLVTVPLVTRIEQHNADGTVNNGETDYVGDSSTDDDFFATAVQAGDRYHIFIGWEPLGEEAENRQRTRRANHTFEALPTSSWAGQNVVAWGLGDSWDDGGTTRVLVPFRASGGSIYAAAFDSADTPSITEQVVTTRNAHKSEYATTPVAVGNGAYAWVFWIDADDNDSIWAAQRSGSTWHNHHQVVDGTGLSFDTLGAWLAGTDTVALLTSTQEGKLYYYEVDISPSVLVGLVTETETALTITPQFNLIPVGLVIETETALTVSPTEVIQVGLVTETESAQLVGIGLSVVTTIETETALQVIARADQDVAIGLVIENETALVVNVKAGEFVGWGIPIGL